jgi:hypothetical protein
MAFESHAYEPHTAELPVVADGLVVVDGELVPLDAWMLLSRGLSGFEL